MKRRKLIMLVAVLAVTVVTGCGKVEDMASTHGTESIADVSGLVEQSVKADKTAEQTAEPAETNAPVETEEPAQTTESAATETPVENEEPAQTAEPAAAEKSVEIEKPAQTTEPAAAEKPAQTTEPVAAETPAATEKPADNQTADAATVFGCNYCGYETTDFMECLAHIFEHEQALPSEPAESESTGSEQPHEHNWIPHTDQRWVPQIVTVVDEPERYEKYEIYIMYWYNTGTWEETRDHSRFEAWWNDAEGGNLYALYNFNKPEDSPLFLGYNELGQPTYQGDHAILPENYDYIPAVTHEEDQGYYETYVDYYYCDCGAIK